MKRSRMAALALAGCLEMTFGAGKAGAQQADVALVYRLLQDGRMVVTSAGGAERVARVGDRLRNGDQVYTRSWLRSLSPTRATRSAPPADVTTIRPSCSSR